MKATAHTMEHMHKDYTGAKMGMWLFLVTELVLFGGMFLLYSVYRAKHPAEFHESAAELNTMIGTINTLILLTSSLTMAISIASARSGRKNLAMALVAVTIILGAVFLVDKYFEWGTKIQHGLYPNGPELAKRSMGEMLFFGLYYSMTGLHGLHVLIGMVILAVTLRSLPSMPKKRVSFVLGGLDRLRGGRIAIEPARGENRWTGEEIDETVKELEVTVKYHAVPERIGRGEFSRLEIAGLYWHLVDIIWIFLFPLFYLIT